MPPEQNTIKKDFFWNTAGSGIYALSSMFLAFAAMHIAGADDGGIFGFGFSTFGQQMFIIAYFGIRPFHITDSSFEYSYNSYRSLRRITAFAAVAAALIYLVIMSAAGSYSFHKAAIVFLLALCKIADGVADLYESECQREGMLWLGGKELAIRTVLASAVLIAVMAFTRNVLAACAAAVITQYVCIIIFKVYTESRIFRIQENVCGTALSQAAETADGEQRITKSEAETAVFKPMDAKNSSETAASKSEAAVSKSEAAASKSETAGKRLETAAGKSETAGSKSETVAGKSEIAGNHFEIAEETQQDLQAKTMRPVNSLTALMSSTLLLFLSVFVDFYIFSAAKYAVDRYLNDAANGIFNILFMPTSVIYLVANFIIKPYMTRLSAIYELRRFDEFETVLRKLLLAVAVLSAAAVTGALLLGKPVLTILEYLLGSEYKGTLSSCHMIFVCIILGGCFYAISNLYYYVLVIMRRQKMIFAIYCIVAVAAFVLSSWAVQSYKITGAALIYPCYMLIGTICFALSCKFLLNAVKQSAVSEADNEAERKPDNTAHT